MKSRLNIAGVDVGFMSALPISINLSVADVREPGKRNSHYSKTIQIPGTPLVNQIFEWAFQTNIESDTFNANLKTDAAYYVNEVKVYDGKLQLLRVRKEPSGAVIYECSIMGETGNLFLEIANRELTDLDFSDLDHTFTHSSSLFTPTLGVGYCYPFIDYGCNPEGTPAADTWTFEHLKPAIFEKEYIDRIFADAGYTYTSNYLSSTYAKSIIIPDVNPGPLQLDATTLANNQFNARISVSNSNNLAATAGPIWVYAPLSEIMPFNDDSSTGYFDPGGVFNTSTHRFSPSISAAFSLHAKARVAVSINMPATAVSYVANFTIVVHIQKSVNGGTNWTNVMSPSLSTSQITTTTHEVLVEVPTTFYTLPHIFRAWVEVKNITAVFVDGSSGIVTTGTSSMDANYGGEFGAVLTSGNLPTGGTVAMNETIPTEVKQLDFLTSIIKAENLYMEQDKTNPLNYIIEPREDFIQETDPLDWTSKLDVSKPILVTPMGELNAKRYVFTYKSDKDHFNQLYETEFKEVYGTETIEVESDFVKGEKKVELAFSATPTASAVGSNLGTDIVAPRFYTQADDGTVKPLKCNIRRLYWGGLIDCAGFLFLTSGYLNTASGSGGSYTAGQPVPTHQYPFCGHVDHPLDPTVDLNFDNPLKVYWMYPGQTFTNNDRYGARYSKMLSEIIHRDSKIVLAYFNLNERDISEFSFRKQVFVKDTYYFVNEIKDYDPQEQKSIPVELLKLQKGPIFEVVNGISHVSGGGSTTNNAKTSANYNTKGNYGGPSIGTGNLNFGSNVLIIGSNNTISG